MDLKGDIASILAKIANKKPNSNPNDGLETMNLVVDHIHQTFRFKLWTSTIPNAYLTKLALRETQTLAYEMVIILPKI